MFQAGTNVFIGLFSISTIVALLMPLEASTVSSFPRMSGQDQGLSVAVVASNSASLTLDILDSQHQIASFTEESALLDSLQTIKPIQENKAVLASASQVISAEIEEAKVPTPTSVAIQPQIEAALDASAYTLNGDKLFEMINQHRIQVGLPALQKNEEVMQIAASRAPELFDEIFVNGNMHAGFNARQLPYPSTENIIYYSTEEGAFNWWMNSSIHRAAIDGNYTYAGIGCEGKACAMIFTNL